MFVMKDELDHFKEKFKNILLVVLLKVQIQTGSGSTTLVLKSFCSDSCMSLRSLKVGVNRVRLSLRNTFSEGCTQNTENARLREKVEHKIKENRTGERIGLLRVYTE
jgi:hypothetical protein